MHFLVAAKHTSRVHSTPSSHSSSAEHSQRERSRAQRPPSQVATMQSASFGPRQSALRTHLVFASSLPGSGLGASGCGMGGSGSRTVDAGSWTRTGVGGRLGAAAFARGEAFRVTSGSRPRLATTAMTKHATTSPSARGHQILRLLSVTTAHSPRPARVAPERTKMASS